MGGGTPPKTVLTIRVLILSGPKRKTPPCSVPSITCKVWRRHTISTPILKRLQCDNEPKKEKGKEKGKEVVSKEDPRERTRQWRVLISRVRDDDTLNCVLTSVRLERKVNLSNMVHTSSNVLSPLIQVKTCTTNIHVNLVKYLYRSFINLDSIFITRPSVVLNPRPTSVLKLTPI